MSFIKNAFSSKTMGTKAPGVSHRADINANAFGRTKYEQDKAKSGIQGLRDRAGTLEEGVDEKEQRAKQTSLSEALRSRAAGEQPSAAEISLKRATDRNLSQQLAAARSGNVSASGRRGLAQQGAMSRQDAAGQMSALRAQEQADSENRYANFLGAVRQQDAATQARSTALGQSALGTELGLEEADRQGRISAEQLNVQNALGMSGTQAGLQNTAMQGRQAMAGGVMQGIGSIFGMQSDKNSKKNVSALSMSSEDSKKKTKKVKLGEGIQAVKGVKGVGPKTKKEDKKKEEEEKEYKMSTSKNPLTQGVSNMMEGFAKAIRDKSKSTSSIETKTEIAPVTLATPEATPAPTTAPPVAAPAAPLNTEAGMAKATPEAPAADADSKAPEVQKAQDTPAAAPPAAVQSSGAAALAQGMAGLIKGISGAAALEEAKEMGKDAMSSMSSAAPAAAMAMSDEKNKENVSSNPEHEFINALAGKAKTWEYKDPDKHGEGRFMGHMAQDIEKAGPIGESMVIDGPDGKMVDYGKGFGAILAIQSELYDMLKKKENRGK